MASKLAPVDYSRYAYRSGWNNELLGRALMYKQEKYDEGYDKLQTYYQNVLSIDLAREQDREYFHERLKRLQNEVVQVGMGDLGRPGVAENIASHIAQAADDKVLNGYIGTLAGQKIKSQAQQTFEKDPERYSDLNLSYSLQDYNKWLQNPTVGAAYTGGTNYVPYTDIVEQAREIIKELEPNAYVDFNKTSGEFTFRKQNGEYLSDQTIKSALEATIMKDPNVVQQININAWGQFRGVTNDEFVADFRELAKTNLDAYNKEIERLKRKKLSPKMDDAKLAAIDAQISSLNANKKTYSEALTINDSEVLGKRGGIEYQLYKDSFINDLADAYEYHKIKDIGFEMDKEGFDRWKLNEKAKQKKDENYSKGLAEGLKFYNQTQDPDQAALMAEAYGVHGNAFKDFLNRDIQVSSDKIQTENRDADFYKSTFNLSVAEANLGLDEAKDDLVTFVRDKNKFGLGAGFPKDPKEVEEFENDYLKSLDSKGWDAMKKQDIVAGEWSDFQISYDNYKEAQKKHAISKRRRKEVEETVDKLTFSSLKNNQKYTTKNDKFEVKRSSIGEYVVTPIVNMTRKEMGKFASHDVHYRTKGKPFVLRNDAALKQFLEDERSFEFEGIDTKSIYENIYNETFGGELTPGAIQVTDNRTAHIARKAINDFGIQNLDKNFRDKLESSASAYGLNIEAFMENITKNKIGADETYPVFAGMKMGADENTAYLEIGGERQNIPLNLLQSYEGKKLSEISATLKDKREELMYQRDIVDRATKGEVVYEYKQLPTLTFEYEDGTEDKLFPKVTYQINTNKAFPLQVKPILEVRDKNNVVRASKYLENNAYLNLYDAKQLTNNLLGDNVNRTSFYSAILAEALKELEKEYKEEN